VGGWGGGGLGEVCGGGVGVGGWGGPFCLAGGGGFGDSWARKCVLFTVRVLGDGVGVGGLGVWGVFSDNRG